MNTYERAKGILSRAGAGADMVDAIGALRDLVQAVERAARNDHRQCESRWAKMAEVDPGRQTTMHSWETHLP